MTDDNLDSLIISGSADSNVDFSGNPDGCFLGVGDGVSEINSFNAHDYSVVVDSEFIKNQNSVKVFGQDSSLVAKDLKENGQILVFDNEDSKELFSSKEISEEVKKFCKESFLFSNYSLILYDGRYFTDILCLDWVKALNEQNLVFTRNGLIYIRIDDGVIPLNKGDVLILDKETNKPITVLEQVMVTREKAIEREEPLVGAIYEHANGKHYEILSVAIDHENSNIHRVIYRQVDGDGTVWSRTVDDFLGEIDREKYPSHPFKYRFQLVK